MKSLISKISIVSSLVLIMLLIITLFVPCAAAQGVVVLITPPQCWALVVGLDGYQNGVTNWYYGVEDATNMAQALTPAWGSSHVKLLTGAQATKAGVLAGISWLASNAHSADTVLFFFAGAGTSYLYPYDDLTTSYANDISGTELTTAFSAVTAQKITFIFDRPESSAIRDAVTGSGHVVMFAAGISGTFWYSITYQYSFFGHYLVDAFSNFDTADANHDSEMAAEELFAYAASLTTSHYPSQVPTMYDSYAGDLPLIDKFVFNTSISLPAGATIVTIDGNNYSSIPMPFYWAPGGYHAVTVPEQVNGTTGTRYVFTGWNGGGTDSAITVSHGSYTANFSKQFLLTISSLYGTVTGDGWYNSGATASFSVTNHVETSDTKRDFSNWSGDYSGTSASGSLDMNSPKSVTGNWQSSYLLTLNSAYGSPSGAGWYNEGTSVNISVDKVQGLIIRYVFDNWSGDLNSTDASTSVIMNAPKTITANWHTDYMYMYILIVIIVVIVIAVVITFMVLRRKGGKPRPPASAPSAGPTVPPAPGAGPSIPPPPSALR